MRRLFSRAGARLRNELLFNILESEDNYIDVETLKQRSNYITHRCLLLLSHFILITIMFFLPSDTACV